MNVLVIEDDALLASGLLLALSRSGYQATHAQSGGQALTALRTGSFDLLILDLGLPDLDGMQVLQAVRRDGLDVPVLVLTARDGVEQQVAALDAGADDYMEKPFDLRELEARVRALIRRSHADFDQKITLGALVLHPFQRSLTLGGELLDLPPREYEVLEALLLNAGKLVHKSRLAQRLALSSDGVGDNAVEVYVHRLRKRLQGQGVAIRTVRGTGYCIQESACENHNH